MKNHPFETNDQSNQISFDALDEPRTIPLGWDTSTICRTELNALGDLSLETEKSSYERQVSDQSNG
ncbi:MAG: hypothetical protein NTZ74_16135 [Chloroflexi bacterium]|nr:hypothetical protein [Chloroflexota bacterium]